MATCYYTKTDETPAVYHTNQACTEGLKIEQDNRVDADTLPVGRRLCSVC